MSEQVGLGAGSGPESVVATVAGPFTPRSRPAGSEPGNTSHRHGSARLGLACVRRQFGGRRYARNWAVRTLKEDLIRYRETGEETDAPSLAGLRKR